MAGAAVGGPTTLVSLVGGLGSGAFRAPPGSLPQASRSGFSAPMTVSKARTLGSGCGMSKYSKATEINTLKFTISGCCIETQGIGRCGESLSFELSCKCKKLSSGLGGK